MSLPPRSLSKREYEALIAMGRCGSTRDAATELGLTQGGFKGLLTNAYRRLQVDGFWEAMNVLGWLVLPEGELDPVRTVREIECLACPLLRRPML